MGLPSAGSYPMPAHAALPRSRAARRIDPERAAPLVRTDRLLRELVPHREPKNA